MTTLTPSPPPPSESPAADALLPAGKSASKKAATGFSQPELERRLSQLKESAESIQSLSSWCLKFPHQHKRIVSSWLKVLKRVKNSQRLPLFYLANDVIQHGKRKQMNFVDSFGNVLETAMPLVRDEKLRPAINRILKIWQERAVFSQKYIDSLTAVIENVVKADSEENAKIISDFRLEELLNQVRQVEQSEKITDSELRQVNLCQFHATSTNIEDVRANVKSRAQSRVFGHELEECVEAVQSYVAALDCEIRLRAEFVEQLERAEIYYETQRNDAKVVSLAYKNFGRRLHELKKRLEETVPNLAALSPVPSPDMDAPSPTGSDDLLHLPDEELTSCHEVNDSVTDPGQKQQPVPGDAPGLDPRSEIERMIGRWALEGDARDILSGEERERSPIHDSRTRASCAASSNGTGISSGGGGRAASAGGAVPPLRRAVTCDERLAQLFPAMFGASEALEASDDTVADKESTLFPESTRVADTSVLADELIDSPSTQQRSNTGLSNGFGTPTAMDSENTELAKPGDEDQLEEEDYDDDEDHLVTSLVRRVDARLQKQQEQRGHPAASNGVLWTDIPRQEGSLSGLGVVNCFQAAAIPGLDLSRVPPDNSPSPPPRSPVALSRCSAIAHCDSPDSSPSVTPPPPLPITPSLCPPPSYPPVFPPPCSAPFPSPFPSAVPHPCPPPVPPPCPPPVPPPCPPHQISITLPPAFAAPPVTADPVFQSSDASSRRQWDQSVDEFIQRLQRGGKSDTSSSDLARDVDLRSEHRACASAAVDRERSSNRVEPPGVDVDERQRSQDRVLCDKSRSQDEAMTSASTATELQPTLAREMTTAGTADDYMRVNSPLTMRQNSEEHVQYIATLGVFRRVKQEPADDLCEEIPLPGEARSPVPLGPVPSPLRVRVLSAEWDRDRAEDSDDPQMVWHGKPQKTPPPLVDIADLPSNTYGVNHSQLRSSHRRRDRSSRTRRLSSRSSSVRSSHSRSSDSGRHARRHRRRDRSSSFHERRPGSKSQKRSRRRSSSEEDSSSQRRRRDRRQGDSRRHHSERHRKRSHRHRRRRSSSSDSDTTRKRHRRRHKEGATSKERRFDYSQVGAGAKHSSDDHSSRRRR